MANNTPHPDNDVDSFGNVMMPCHQKRGPFRESPTKSTSIPTNPIMPIGVNPRHHRHHMTTTSSNGSCRPPLTKGEAPRHLSASAKKAPKREHLFINRASPLIRTHRPRCITSDRRLYQPLAIGRTTSHRPTKTLNKPQRHNVKQERNTCILEHPIQIDDRGVHPSSAPNPTAK